MSISGEARERNNPQKQIKRCSTPHGRLLPTSPPKCNGGKENRGTALMITVPTPSGKYDSSVTGSVCGTLSQVWQIDRWWGFRDHRTDKNYILAFKWHLQDKVACQGTKQFISFQRVQNSVTNIINMCGDSIDLIPVYSGLVLIGFPCLIPYAWIDVLA